MIVKCWLCRRPIYELREPPKWPLDYRLFQPCHSGIEPVTADFQCPFCEREFLVIRQACKYTDLPWMPILTEGGVLSILGVLELRRCDLCGAALDRRVRWRGMVVCASCRGAEMQKGRRRTTVEVRA